MKKVLKILILCVVFSLLFVGLCFADDIINKPISNAYHSMFLPINANHLNNIPMYQVNDSVADIYSIRRRVNERTMMAVAGGGDKRHIYKARAIVGGVICGGLIIEFLIVSAVLFEQSDSHFMKAGVNCVISLGLASIGTAMLFSNMELLYLENNYGFYNLNDTESELNKALKKANGFIVGGLLLNVTGVVLGMVGFHRVDNIDLDAASFVFMISGSFVGLTGAVMWILGFNLKAQTKWKLETLFEVNENGASLRLSW